MEGLRALFFFAAGLACALALFAHLATLPDSPGPQPSETEIVAAARVDRWRLAVVSVGLFLIGCLL